MSDLVHARYDAIIDVRSPSEYREDRLPGARSLPVLSDEERARVGTIYKQESPFRARKLGAALVFRNAAAHIEGPLAEMEGGWRPLVYCWRGGQRSGSFAWMLNEIGWRADVLEGGYRSFRRAVVARLYDRPLNVSLIQLGGYTGTGKTEILARLSALGVQTLDLEGLARHRGSLLGSMAEPQPSQKSFETAIAFALEEMDPSRPVVVEAESSKIGTLTLPPSLWQAMKTAPWIEVTAPIEARARYLARAYDDILSDTATLRRRLDVLRQFRGHEVVTRWHGMIHAGDRTGLTRALAADHYDPAYDKAMRSLAPRILHRVEAPDLTPAALDAVAWQVARTVQNGSI